MMGDFDEMREEHRARRRNRLNAIEVREPKRYPEDSAGIEVEVQTSETQSSVLDLSRREAVDLIEKLQRHLAATSPVPAESEHLLMQGVDNDAHLGQAEPAPRCRKCGGAIVSCGGHWHHADGMPTPAHFPKPEVQP